MVTVNATAKCALGVVQVHTALVILLPRVTAPALTADEIARMDTWDFCQLANAVVDFLQPSSDLTATDTGNESSDAPANA